MKELEELNKVVQEFNKSVKTLDSLMSQALSIFPEEKKKQAKAMFENAKKGIHPSESEIKIFSDIPKKINKTKKHGI